MEDKKDIKGYSLFMAKNISIMLLTIALILIEIKLLFWELGFALALAAIVAFFLSKTKEGNDKKVTFYRLDQIREAFMIFSKD